MSYKKKKYYVAKVYISWYGYDFSSTVLIRGISSKDAEHQLRMDINDWYKSEFLKLETGLEIGTITEITQEQFDFLDKTLHLGIVPCAKLEHLTGRIE